MLQSRTPRTNNESIRWWRTWATRHRVAAAILAGVVATHVATIFGYWFPGVGLTRLDWNTANGSVYVPSAAPLAKFVTGGVFHYLDGILFAVVYACALHPVLPWRNSMVGNLTKGLAFGTLLAVISVAFMTPRVYGPARGVDPGFLSLELGGTYILTVFVWHWVYGLHLSLIYNPLPATEGPAELSEHTAPPADDGRDDSSVLAKNH
ncbi:hypothetical protein ACH40E_22365 [Streptomyces acidicola]|uniref:hypothetical protein n=1 Tax=Streptomyces acidicola TaxID=2596892 RepID=UPI00378D8790